MIWVRILSALLAVGLLGACYWFGGIHGLVAICGLAIFISIYEYSSFLKTSSATPRRFFLLTTFSFFLLCLYTGNSAFLTVFYFLVFAFYTTLKGGKESLEIRWEFLSKWTIGLLYCGLMPAMIVRGLMELGLPYFIGLLLLSFGTDTFAFIGGKIFGKRKLIPRISPNKTVEGALSGLLGGSAAGFLFYFWTASQPLNYLVLVATCLLGSLFTQAGDLFESFMKRYSGVKDSGSLMPGHGGILDRIDGVLFAGPILYLGIQYFYQ